MAHYVLILAAGKGSRLTNSITPKQFLEINGLPAIMHSIKVFQDYDKHTKIYIGLPQDYNISDWESMCKKYMFNTKHIIYSGGETRFYTVLRGLKLIKKTLNKEKNDNSTIVSIHDAARPFIDNQFLFSLISKINKSNIKAVLPIINTNSSMVKKKNKNEYMPVNRDEFSLCQTPQCFKFKYIYEAYNNQYNYFKNKKDNKMRSSNEIVLYDDFSVFFENQSHTEHFKRDLKNIQYVPGRDYNIKITTDLDYILAEEIHRFLKKQT